MKIEKRSYSVNPWRLIDSMGREIPCTKVAVDRNGNRLVYQGSVSGKTKTECVDTALELLERLLDCWNAKTDVTPKQEA